jgi:hypothetical protein
MQATSRSKSMPWDSSTRWLAAPNTPYPSDTSSPADVYRALGQAGFVQVDSFRTMEYVWLFE